MLRKILLFVFTLMLVTGTYAQKNGVAPLAKGEQQLNFGLGFNDYGFPIYVSYDFAVHKDVTVTPQVNVTFDDDVHFGVLVKSDYHWNYLIGIPNDWDFYTGARIGVDIFDGSTNLDFGIQVGGRWYWSEKWGLNMEIAGGTGFGTVIGVSLKM